MARGRSTNHAESKNKERSRSQSKARKLKCYHCHKEGHYRKDCPECKGKKKDNSKTGDAGVVEDNSDGDDVLLITISSSDRWHIPELSKNLISLGTLDSNGCSYWAAGGVMRIMKGALVVMKGLKQQKQYMVKFIRVVHTTKVFDAFKKEELIDARKDHGVKEKVELEVRAPDSLPIIPTDEEDGSYSTEENEEPLE
ncbi:hypothetical protein RJ639_009803 [Escallonia herrerae]|uniref:CCHC-type domain-containing protein n=1 Tax=Escallonia herrerae TaxID=1293975 RepID=A0AA89ASP5_9ASTE|nr:hypothetical protein RJ639_009803 [Escallonia herrerae]